MRLLILLFLLLVVSRPGAAAQPNFLVIITDDQNFGTVTEKWMPHTKTEIFDKGIIFENAFISSPQCCPSRAAIVTGKYAKNNGQLSNSAKHNLRINTCGFYLKQRGYRTGIVGKYLNSNRGHGYTPYHRNQFDYWYVSEKDDSFTSHLGESAKHREHSSSWITSKAIDFLSDNTGPFLLLVSFHEPHGLAKLDNSYRHIFRKPQREDLDRSKANYLTLGKNKPKWLLKKPKRSRPVRHHYEIQSFNKLQVVDVHIKSIIDVLRSTSQYDNTYIFFLSDNGVLFGQHGLFGKSVPYESAIRVPLALKGPGIASGVSPNIAANIDIAPTIYRIAGLDYSNVDGIDLLSEQREYLYLEGAYISERRWQPRFSGIVYQEWRLFETEGDRSELYNIGLDRYQLNNLFYNEKYKDIRQKLQGFLQAEESGFTPL